MSTMSLSVHLPLWLYWACWVALVSARPASTSGGLDTDILGGNGAINVDARPASPSGALDTDSLGGNGAINVEIGTSPGMGGNAPGTTCPLDQLHSIRVDLQEAMKDSNWTEHLSAGRLDISDLVDYSYNVLLSKECRISREEAGQLLGGGWDLAKVIAAKDVSHAQKMIAWTVKAQDWAKLSLVLSLNPFTSPLFSVARLREVMGMPLFVLWALQQVSGHGFVSSPNFRTTMISLIELLSLEFENFRRSDVMVRCDFATLYFLPSYIMADEGRRIKNHINYFVQKEVGQTGLLPECPRDEVPDVGGKPKLMVVSSKWAQLSPVYRNFVGIVRELSEHYALTLLRANNWNSDESFFEAEYIFHMERSFDQSVGMILDPLTLDTITHSTDPHFPCAGDRFAGVLFLDVGMAPETMYLANTRIAKVQLVTYGHSISTFGASEIDGWIAGEGPELADEFATNYGEPRLYVVPGPGVLQVNIAETFVPWQTRLAQAPDGLVINCLWSLVKISVEGVDAVIRVHEEMVKRNTNVTFQFFTSVDPFGQAKAYLDHQLIGINTNFISLQDEAEYISILQNGHVTMDGIPYGGCNTVYDSLISRIPVVMLEGRAWHNRVGPYWTRQVVPDSVSKYLIAQSLDEYVEQVVALLTEEALYQHVCESLEALDTKQLEAPGLATLAEYPSAIKRALAGET